jgi:hypothetical protein
VTDNSGAVVVPMFSELPAEGADTPDPWRMLAEGTGMLVAWEPAPTKVTSWGAPLSATSGLARQLATVVQKAGAQLPATGETLMRVQLPAGQTVANLVPAVGGGLRGMTKLAGSSDFAGHARLFPVAGTAAAGAAAVPLGPLLAVLALSVGVEMLASHQQEAKLDAIKEVVERLENHEVDKLVAALDSAEGVLHDSMTALLDKLDVPEAVGLGSTAGSVKETKALALNWLSKWETVADRFESDRRVDIDDLKEHVAKTAIGGFEAFGQLVQLTYRALALDSRVHIVAMAEATLQSPDESVEHFQRSIQRRLVENADNLDRLKRLVRRFASMRLTVNVARIDKRNELSNLQSRLVRLAFALADTPELPPLLTADQRLVIEAVRREDGSIIMLEPRAEAGA